MWIHRMEYNRLIVYQLYILFFFKCDFVWSSIERDGAKNLNCFFYLEIFARFHIFVVIKKKWGFISLNIITNDLILDVSANAWSALFIIFSPSYTQTFIENHNFRGFLVIFLQLTVFKLLVSGESHLVPQYEIINEREYIIKSSSPYRIINQREWKHTITCNKMILSNPKASQPTVSVTTEREKEGDRNIHWIHFQKTKFCAIEIITRKIWNRMNGKEKGNHFIRQFHDIKIDSIAYNFIQPRILQ